LYTCCGASGPDPDFTTIYYHSSSLPPNGANGARYVSQEADRCLEEGRETADPAQRAAVYHRLAALLAHDLPTLALWHENSVLAINDGVQGDFTALGMCWIPGTLPSSVQWHKVPPENN
jgi:ABC-type transport system substrate-binding protein